LRKKNRLMRAGRVEEAGALAVLIGKDISKHEKGRFCKPGGGKMEAKDIWAAVRELTGGSHSEANCAGINAESLNQHYSNISTDSRFSQPPRKQSADTTEASYIAEYQVFHILDRLHHTATGLDGLPAWFLRLGAPAFSKPITRLFNLSITTSTVPKQWKHASIRPVAKVPAPKLHADFRPISITPVLTRVMEKTVVSHFLYPAFQSPPPNLTFCDQFAFRPTGSTTAAIITLVQTITTMLITNPYVIVVSLDFSKAFDTVRHSTLLEKMAQLDLPDNVYNWLVNFFSEHTHSTVYKGERSKIKSITASIIQGSSIGPASYVVNAGDLKAVTPGNCLVKFADDTYIVIPALNVDSRTAEVGNVETWACQNNLQLNASKTKEIIFVDRRRKRQIYQPPPLSEIKRVSSMKILGVTWTSGLAASEHVGDVIKRCAQTMYALRVLRTKGMSVQSLHDIYRSVVVAKILYASSAWYGFTSVTERQRIDTFFERSKKSGFCPPDLPSFDELCETADDKLFNRILSNSSHILHPLLPPPNIASINYNLRPRAHNLTLPKHFGLVSDSNFISRMLYKNIY